MDGKLVPQRQLFLVMPKGWMITRFGDLRIDWNITIGFAVALEILRVWNGIARTGVNGLLWLAGGFRAVLEEQKTQGENGWSMKKTLFFLN